MKCLTSPAIAASVLAQHVVAVSWYFLEWNTPSADSTFLSFSMNMVAPALQKAGVYYVWPGLQDTGNTGVYQEVLDGKSGTWWIGAGWCCSNPSLPWGSGFNVPNSDTVEINMTRDIKDANWTSELTMGDNYALSSFPLAYKNFNQALLAIELYDVSWDFGELVWENVTMVVNSTETAWCTDAPTNYDSATKFTSTTPVVKVNGLSTTCTIDKVVMEGPS